MSSILIISVNALGTDSTIPIVQILTVTLKQMIFINNIGKVVLIVTIPRREALHKCAFIIHEY